MNADRDDERGDYERARRKDEDAIHEMEIRSGVKFCKGCDARNVDGLCDRCAREWDEEDRIERAIAERSKDEVAR